MVCRDSVCGTQSVVVSIGQNGNSTAASCTLALQHIDETLTLTLDNNNQCLARSRLPAIYLHVRRSARSLLHGRLRGFGISCLKSGSSVRTTLTPVYVESLLPTSDGLKSIVCRW